MRFEFVTGKYKHWRTRYYACFADGKILISTRKRDLPRVDIKFSMPPRYEYEDAQMMVVGCPKCQKAHLYPPRSFILQAVEVAKDCEELGRLTEIYELEPEIGWLVLESVKEGKKIAEIPKAMRRRLLKGDIEAAKKLIDLNVLTDVLTDEARIQLLSLMLGK